MEEIFVESAHLELIKKAKPLALLMASKNKLKDNVIQVLWRKAMEAHEDLSETTENLESGSSSFKDSGLDKNSDEKIYFDFLIEIAEHCSLNTLLMLCRKFDSIPNISFSKDLIHFFTR